MAKVSWRRRFMVAWDAHVKGRVFYNVPVTVNVRLDKGGVSMQDLIQIQERVHAGVYDALEEQKKTEAS